MKDEIDLLLEIEWLELEEHHKKEQCKLLLKAIRIRKKQFDDSKKKK
jgi:hypothetical protein